jgi:exopolysaccharide biosynthesis polyprenyl glycosylphosphotransferase
MNSNGILRKHWTHVSLHFALDILLFMAGFFAASLLRFGDEYFTPLIQHWPLMMAASVAFSSASYTLGLYAVRNPHATILRRLFLLAIAIMVAVLCELIAAYSVFSDPLGRGALFLSATFAYGLSSIHHIAFLRALRMRCERVAYVVSSEMDELETRLFDCLGGSNLKLVGLIEANGYRATSRIRVLGNTSDLASIVHHEKIARVLATDEALKDAKLCRKFCQLRYSGITVMPLISLCEEVDQCVPLELISTEWLLTASGEPNLIYIQKAKRLFDIVASLAFLILASPVLLLAILAVKLTSKGPVFYSQVRSGRLGRTFRMTKLRSMHVGAEKNGAQWCCGASDPRVTPVGSFLRRYRIDEIPQLFHVLAGDMSFVGPRPERPEMIAQLAREVPFYRERTLIQPGITGWAQVNYPYGACVEDAARKLEYDLYYMKHMSVFLDIFILLDTVRIVLGGGVSGHEERVSTRNQAITEWAQLRTATSTKVEKSNDLKNGALGSVAALAR